MATMAMAGMAGVFLGVFLIMVLRVTDTSIKTVDDAETGLGLSVFSVVPNMPHLRNGKSRLVVAEQAQSEAAEAFRTLRTSLTMLGRPEDRRVSLFTSAVPSEGKTFCAINYAASLAQVGHRTLLIDADLRRAALEAALVGPDHNSLGLTEYLTGGKSLAEVVQPAKVENLFFVSGGSTAANPAELLARDGLSSIIADALRCYDRVVLDSAPITAVSDTLLILKNAQHVCLVVRAAHTSSRYVRRCLGLLLGAEASLSGIILNRMPRRRDAGYAAYYDYQHHGKYGKKGVYGSSR
jgi:capsular exopolysaccharide synthesis family protein